MLDTQRLLEDRRITLEHLRAFVAIADQEGFEGAARLLFRTQSAISQSVKKLESVLNCPLLVRKQGHMCGLTEEGERLLPLARDILARLSDAVSALNVRPLRGLLRLGVPDDFSMTYIHEMLSYCISMNPDLRLQVTSTLSSVITEMMESNTLDVAVIKESSDRYPSSARAYTLKEEPLYWVASQTSQFETLETIPLVAFPDGCAYRRAAINALKKMNKPVWLAYTSASYENIRNAVSSGLGIAPLPVNAVADDHMILQPEQGFPALPNIQLNLYLRSEDPISLQLAEYLKRALKSF